MNVIIIDRVIEKGEGRRMICVGCSSPRLNYRTVEDYRYVTRGREGKGFICRVYIYISSFFLIRSRVQRLKLNLRAKCTRCFIEDCPPDVRSIERYIYMYIFLFCLEILHDSIERLITLAIVPSARITRIEEN